MSLSEWTQTELKRLEQKIDQVDSDLEDLRTTLLDRMRQLEERYSEVYRVTQEVIRNLPARAEPELLIHPIHGPKLNPTDTASRDSLHIRSVETIPLTNGPATEEVVNEKGERWDT